MKKLSIGIGIFFFLLVAIIVTVILSIRSIVTREFIVNQLESSFNVRADLRQININLFSGLSSVELEGLDIYTRDNFADNAVELEKRTPVTGSILSIQKIDLKLNFLALLRRSFQVKNFVFIGPFVSIVLSENGNNLSYLFQKPKIVEGKPNPNLSEKTEESKETKEEPFTIHSIPLAAQVGKIGIENGKLEIFIQKTQQKISLEKLNLLLTDIDIDPANLEKHNSIHLKLNTNISVFNSEGRESALFKILSNGTIVPFVPKTGYINPSIDYYLTMQQGSYIDGLSILDALSGKLPILADAGIKMDSLSKKAEILRDVEIALNYSNQRITFLKEILFPTANYDLTLESKSWLHIGNNEHNFKGAVLASKQESEQAIGGVDAAIKSKLKKGDPVEIRNKLLGNIVKADRMNLPFTSSGNIKSPNVQLDVSLPSILELTKGIIGDVIKDELKKKLPPGATEVINNGLKKLF
ncbi:MAG TPA: hypothetical protein PK079_23290 [Leptospiraceae bacterium]|nr:hypothetical protein [Leptospiraceae bacterium]HMW05094.1 hypothetical protein [Leptospiraceae bacterium]HMX31348.1 hypothetical protein [Leptospiraceae bacterium]HMY31609.1 hypothetical protein [Leptospiraceae bacterium]HMZ66131.1 hypothetical protein [Leptospiraceae bacterium]